MGRLLERLEELGLADRTLLAFVSDHGTEFLDHDRHFHGHNTYGELNRRANRLAHWLQGRGVGPEVRVGICTERSSSMVVAVLAVLKAGGAYVPLDPGYPCERLRYMLSDSGTRLLLTQDSLLDRFSDWDGELARLDRLEDTLAEQDETNPDSGVGPENLAYVIYTSGSTGRPKGVLVPHRGVVNHNVAVSRDFGLRADDRVPSAKGVLA